MCSETTESITEAVDEGRVAQMRLAVGIVDNRQDGADAYTPVATTLKKGER